uniref:DEK-C domain-containing protein n=1 Tax=Salix viminalis TaxID=40686 RepID=A0A6N2N2M9_SALVM
MDSELQRKIKETVIDILRHANLDEITEFKVRATATERLDFDMSHIEHRKFIRGVVESFLLSTMDEEGKEANGNVGENTKEALQEEHEEVLTKKVVGTDSNRVICKNSSGKSFLSIRDFYQKDGNLLPSKIGICLTSEQWTAIKQNVPAIEEAIMKMQSMLSSGLDVEQNGQISKQAADSISQELPPEIARFEVSRFDGKNYQFWAPQMEFFLKQLKIAYVLTVPRPSVATSPLASAEEIAQAKATEQKWCNDDYLCRLNILNSLSDSIYYKYVKKIQTAKEYGEELKLVYLYEEFGTRRSQVKKYIEFQMVDEKSIVDQLQELNGIADAIVAAGMFIDENFHVSTVISKLPPSWKDFCMKLMHEEYLPFWILMDRVRVEEESRNQDK